MLNRAVFFDRDGVITVPIFRDGRSFAPRILSDFKIYDHAKEALDLAKKNDLLVVVITNQPDINANFISPETMIEMNRILLESLPIDMIKVCPHTRDENCTCRKPKAGLILEACKELNIDNTKSFVVGDRKSDVEAGIEAQCKTVFIDHNYRADEKTACADYVCKDILEATRWVLGQL
jgi:D-glycero-D-manno-heptose 1,7-bisphosphate phosphatase